jgi:hypothetical protein
MDYLKRDSFILVWQVEMSTRAMIQMMNVLTMFGYRRKGIYSVEIFNVQRLMYWQPIFDKKRV